MKNTAAHESQGSLCVWASLTGAERGESQHTLKLGVASSNTAVLGLILQATLWDELIKEEEGRSGRADEQDRIGLHYAPSWNPELLLL